MKSYCKTNEILEILACLKRIKVPFISLKICEDFKDFAGFSIGFQLGFQRISGFRRFLSNLVKGSRGV